MKNKVIIISALLVIAVVMFWWLIPAEPKTFEWDPTESPSMRGGQPYDFDLFDQLIERSADKGYKVKKLDYAVGYHTKFESDFVPYRRPFMGIKEIEEADTANNLLVIQATDWTVKDYDESGDEGETEIESTYYIPVSLNLLRFAERGGTALYVDWSFRSDDNLPLLCSAYGLDQSVLPSRYPHYSEDALANRRDDMSYMQVSDDKRVNLNMRYVNSGFFQIGSSSYRHMGQVNSPYYRLMYPNPYDHSYLMVDFFFPESGGHLYVTNLAAYMCNLGVSVPEGPEVIETLMSNIDDKPIVRLQYPTSPYRGQERTDAESPLLSVISANESLSFAWTLLFVLIALVFLAGFLRRHPIKRSVIDDLDKTDAVAVREYQFRRSPLLHFLFQCSWLYEGKKDYTALYRINLRRLARAVKAYTGIELNTANDEEIKRAAELFAVRQQRPASEIERELKRIKEMQFSPITPSIFAESQRIVEKFPMK